MSSALLTALAGIPNLYEPLPGLLTGGQPSAEQLEQFKAAGGTVVLDIRDPMEARPFAEADHARALGLEYANVPISPGATGDERMDRILATLRAHAGKQLLFHCGSGNRVGGAMLAYLILDHGQTEDDATQQAMRIGLRSPEYLHWGLQYAERHQR
jgi:protein tyrosine phosphatase (PTP) superfamily phosphohydrolase (DUF442 family)